MTPWLFFTNDPEVSVQLLDGVKKSLKAQGRGREHMADLLLYEILNAAVRETMPICHIYGHRLRWLQNKLDTEKLRIPAHMLDEVQDMRLELKELLQWASHMKGVVRHLLEDCKMSDDEADSECMWNFGKWYDGNGRSTAIFLRGTADNLDHEIDRMNVLDGLALNFSQDHQRYSDAFTNRTLLMLTVATAVFMPAQFLAAVYGMNFVDDTGIPALPELTWEYGYWYFWVVTGTAILIGICVACRVLR